MQNAKLHFSQAENNYQIKEAYKTLRSNVEFSGQNVRVISVTSCTPGEGKTTVAMALARALPRRARRRCLWTPTCVSQCWWADTEQVRYDLD